MTAPEKLHHKRARGERHGSAKLTAERVRELRHLREAGWSYVELGARFSLHWTTCRSAATRRTWSHI